MDPLSTTPHLITAEKAIELLGGPLSLARRISELMPNDPITQSAVTQWKASRHKMVPLARARVVAQMLGVEPSSLQPEYFGNAEATPAAPAKAAEQCGH